MPNASRRFRIACLAAAMGMQRERVYNAATGSGGYRVSGDVIVGAMRASGLSLAELLGGPVPADRCRACGQIKRGRAA